MSTITRSITVEEYEKMIEEGAIGEDPRLELIEGRLVPKMTKGRRHSAGSELCWRAIDRVIPPGWHVRIEEPVRIPERDSDPEPDVSVARGGINDYLEHDPGPDDVALVVEVSDSTLAHDRALAATYLGGGIAVYWLVNLVDRRLEVYTAEGAGPVFVGEHDQAELVITGQVAGRIAVADMLPRIVASS